VREFRQKRAKTTESEVDQGAHRENSAGRVAEHLAKALAKAAAAERWEIVSELSRQLADLRRDTSGPPLRAVKR